MEKSLSQRIWDLIGVPFRFALLPQVLLPRFGWTTLWTAQIFELCQDAGFVLHQHQRFLYGLNQFYWFGK